MAKPPASSRWTDQPGGTVAVPRDATSPDRLPPETARATMVPPTAAATMTTPATTHRRLDRDAGGSSPGGGGSSGPSVDDEETIPSGSEGDPEAAPPGSELSWGGPSG